MIAPADVTAAFSPATWLSTWIWLFLLGSLLAGSCRKSGGSGEDDPLKTDILKRTRDIYLWNDQIPGDFDPRRYAGPEEIMDAIRLYSKEPGFSEPVDHFSFAMKKTEWDNISTGVATDFGMKVFFYTDDDLRVRMVEEDGPAGRAGIRRGWRIVAVNGDRNIIVDRGNFIMQTIYYSPSCTLRFQKPDGSEVEIPLVAAQYQEDPLYLDTVYTLGAKRVGYLVLNSFLGDQPAIINELAVVFNHFIVSGVTDVVVDLRYNGGGYVSLQQRLANLLIPPALNGSVMMGQEYNANHANENQLFFFEKLGTLDISNVYFIVSDNTASASELLINNLTPYMNVKLVGADTYGKPVGFYDVKVGEWLIFPVSFRSTNGLGKGDYFDGLKVDRVVPDGLDKDWGDRQESRLKAVLSYIESGSYGYAPPLPGLNSVLESQVAQANKKLDRGSFKGAVAESPR